MGAEFGWYPQHLTLHRQGEMVAAMPMYVKTNYYGEFVFDWSWDSAYQSAGKAYYPKLVVAIPYSPTTGARLLANSTDDKLLLIQAAKQVCKERDFSSVHWLFPHSADMKLLTEAGLIPRMGCNYHWHNQNYHDFPQFLQTLRASKRKKINRERRRVTEQNIDMRCYSGSDISDQAMADFHRFYTSTFDKHLGLATLSLSFFLSIRDQLGDAVLLVMAEKQDQAVAGAIFFRSADTLFGRYWGCDRDYDALHFEACYYQGHQIAIDSGLKYFEPGVQGEHKISRGFLPTATWSAHWIEDQDFRPVITQYCQHEQRAIEARCLMLYSRSPYKHETTPPSQLPLINDPTDLA